MSAIARLRRRLENSALLARALGGALGLWIRFCRRTTRWQATGLDALCQDLAAGPVVVVLWHEHLLMGPAHWPRAMGALTGIRDPSPIGRVAGAVQAHFGLGAAAMSRRAPNHSAARQVLVAARGGVSIAITGDGPVGPRGQLQDAPLAWARAAGLPVYCFAWSARRQLRLRSWDRMILPLPFTRGRFAFHRYADPLPRRAEDDAADRAALEAALHSTAARVSPRPE